MCPCLRLAIPKRVLIVGGGDGGSLQQVLRYPSVEEAVVCELDQRVVDFSREYFAHLLATRGLIRVPNCLCATLLAISKKTPVSSM